MKRIKALSQAEEGFPSPKPRQCLYFGIIRLGNLRRKSLLTQFQSYIIRFPLRKNYCG